MGKVMMSGVAPKMKVPTPYEVNFADNTWEQIIDACQKNAVPDTWLVGDQKTMTINETDYTIDIIGKNHDDYTDKSGKAPLTFHLHDCYGTQYQMNSIDSNGGGWNACEMQTTHLPAIKQLMPTEVQNALQRVQKYTHNGYTDGTIIKANSYLFLLSEIEVYGVVTFSHDGEGTQYEYFKAGNSTVKKLNGTDNDWWKRSPRIDNTQEFVNTQPSGKTGANKATMLRGVSFAFCF